MSYVTAGLTGVVLGKDGGKRLTVPVPAPPPRYCGIYFIRCGQYVKIGHSVDIAARLKNVQMLNPFPVRVVGYEPVAGSNLVDREAQLHVLFGGSHHRGEWFHLTEDKAHIRTHTSRWPKDDADQS